MLGAPLREKEGRQQRRAYHRAREQQQKRQRRPPLQRRALHELQVAVGIMAFQVEMAHRGAHQRHHPSPHPAQPRQRQIARACGP
ncbi:hypothetical protein ACFQT0_10675 [Hymenobacter humi]|uniref:Uncharacterized protein n=1 Tax=Hymenobacter humi TaxID=1411620 RepID=A0ABW2U2W5_9BACT